MTNKYHSPIILTIFFLLPFISFCQLPSPFVSTAQISFWAKNVVNQMPRSVSQKLSPLSVEASNHYAEVISANNNFKADSDLCTNGNLACSGEFDQKFDPTSLDTYTVRIGAGDRHTGKKKYKPTRRGNTIIAWIGLKVDQFIFFRLSSLEQGNTIHITNFTSDGDLRTPSFLPSNIASKISLSQDAITRIFPQAFQGGAKTTIETCDAPALKGETKACTKSLEEMIDFAKNQLITKDMKKLSALSLTSLRGSGEELLIQNTKMLNEKKFVSCHVNVLPFASYFCHTISDTRIYSVKLVEIKNKSYVNTLYAICHMNTSSLPAHHILFKILKTRPGESEACHWIADQDLAWIAAN